MKKTLLVIAVVLVLVLAACEPPKWLVGHDNGEAYQKYVEQMKELGRWPDPDGWSE